MTTIDISPEACAEAVQKLDEAAEAWAEYSTKDKQSVSFYQRARLIEALSKRIKELEEQVYVPHLFHCERCSFHVVDKGDHKWGALATECPNCHIPLAKVTERQLRMYMDSQLRPEPKK